MKAYIVTSGEYSDYSIRAVFSSEQKAWEYASLNDDNKIEEYDVDQCALDSVLKSYIFIVYDLLNDRIVNVQIKHTKCDDKLRGSNIFEFYIDNTLQNYKEYSMQKDGNISYCLYTIAHDRIAQYAESIGKSRDMLVREAHNIRRKAIEQEEKIKQKQFQERLKSFFSTSSLR